MIREDTLRNVVWAQQEELQKGENGIPREILSTIATKSSHAIIISGIRRCGKSTLLRQLMKKTGKTLKYINFEDPRLLNFEVTDFEKLMKCWADMHGKNDYYFFDEIQNVPEWERFIRLLVDKKKSCFITGSNASLLSRELGTKLTGRHLTYELLPFSYREWLEYRKKLPGYDSFKEYEQQGGFPEFLEEERDEILQELLLDVLSRDIIVRHKLRDADALKKLAIFLISNIGKAHSYNRLAALCDIKSPMSVLSYISFLEDSFVILTIPKFSYSYKKQMLNPKKVYCIDGGFARANAVNFSPDTGRLLENEVYLHLRRKYKNIYYFKEKKECDFIIVEKNKPILAVQVCHKITDDNQERELTGLKEAMNQLTLKQGVIITSDQEDMLGDIPLVPAWKWFLSMSRTTC